MYLIVASAEGRVVWVKHGDTTCGSGRHAVGTGKKFKKALINMNKCQQLVLKKRLNEMNYLHSES
jgi:hypothetical protein